MSTTRGLTREQRMKISRNKRAAEQRLARSQARAAASGQLRTGGFFGIANNPAEFKFFDTTKALTATATAGAIFNASLNLVPQGTTESNRLGRKMTVTKLDMKCICKLPATVTATDTSDLVRVIVYLDKQANGATAAVADILETADILSFRNLANKDRFRVLHDHIEEIDINSGNGTSASERVKHFHLSKSFKDGLNMEFDNTTGAITEIKSNNIGVLVISREATASLQYVARIRFQG